MLKAKLMNQVKDKFGGQFIKKDGRWYWNNELVTTGWLLNKLNSPTFVPDQLPKKMPEQIDIPAPTPESIKEAAYVAPKKSAPKKKKESETQQ